MVKDIPYDQYALQAVYLAIKSGMCIYSLANNIFLHLCMLHDSTLKILLTSQSRLSSGEMVIPKSGQRTHSRQSGWNEVSIAESSYHFLKVYKSHSKL